MGVSARSLAVISGFCDEVAVSATGSGVVAGAAADRVGTDAVDKEAGSRATSELGCDEGTSAGAGIAAGREGVEAVAEVAAAVVPAEERGERRAREEREDITR